MADWPEIQRGHQKITQGGATTSNSSVVNITATTANVKGAWQEVLSASVGDSDCVWVRIITCLGTSSVMDLLLDIAIGPSGSEQVIVSNLIYGRVTNLRRTKAEFVFPVRVPAGSRVSARVQSTSSNPGVAVQVFLLSGGYGWSAGSRVISLGERTSAATGGTMVDPGTTPNTKAAWYELTAATPAAIRQLSLGFGNRALNTRTDANWLMDVAIGPSGSEQIILPNFSLSGVGTNFMVFPHNSPVFPVAIPAGTRIAVRAQSDINSAIDSRLFDVIGYGVTA